MTPVIKGGLRADEIMSWLIEQGAHFYEWAALDDDESIYGAGLNRLVLCETEVGLTSEALERVESILLRGEGRRGQEHMERIKAIEDMEKTITHPIDEVLQRLVDAHPLLFRGRLPLIPSYPPGGWSAILDRLCSDIETAIGAEACAQIEIKQIKQKFGSLRFYYRVGGQSDQHIDLVSETGHQHLTIPRPSADAEVDATRDRVRQIVDAACEASLSICETCGAQAQLRNVGGYITTLCDEHLFELQAEKDQCDVAPAFPAPPYSQ